MADWYVSSAVYATISAFVASATYNVGDLVKPTAPAFGTSWVFRCTTAGTASTEPTWPTGNNATVASGGATFTNVTGQSAYGWGAAAGTLYSLTNGGRSLIGDRVFLSSDHSESSGNTAATYGSNNGTAAFGLIQHISVNRAGSVPPVEADIQAGASIGTGGSFQNLTMSASCEIFYRGVTITGTQHCFFSGKAHSYKDCAFSFAGGQINWQSAKVTFDNTTARCTMFSSSSQPGDFTWFNTPSAIQGTPPATLFVATANFSFVITCRGVDLSAVTGALLGASQAGAKALLESCKIAAGVSRYAGGGSPADEIELINCWDGSNVLNERHTSAGDVTTDRTTYMSSGAQDDVGNYAFNLISGNADIQAMPNGAFWLDVENTLIGAAKTATVEIVSGAALNNNDIRLLLEYLGTSGSLVSSFGDSLANALTAVASLPSSTAVWPGTVPNIFGAVLNPADINHAGISNAGLTLAGTSTDGCARSTFNVSGKVYFEFRPGTYTANNTSAGICLATASLSTVASASTNAVMVVKNGTIYINTTAQSGSLGARSSGDIIGFAVDTVAKLIWYRVCPSGNWNGSSTANPATGAGGFSYTLSGTMMAYGSANANGDSVTLNFGASAFSGAVPSGFSSPFSSVGPTLTAVPQKLQVGFTPQRAGRVRGLVRLGKPGTSVWVNPQIAIT